MHWQRPWRAALLALALAAILGPLALPAYRAGAAAEAAKLYLVALNEGGVSGTPIGCGDSLVDVPTEIAGGATTEIKITQALTKLFAIKTRDYGESGYITVLNNANLQIAKVAVQDGTAAVYLTGTLPLGGVCDEPRAAGQIEATARQFAGVQKVIVILNGGPLTNAVGSASFPQVPFVIEPPFYPYWEEQGGLPIFGLPLSAQLVEGGFRAQYYERQRFEYHPENQAPYTILFGLLGSETAKKRNLLGTAPFAPVANGNKAGCEYFADTKHTLCTDFGFRAYWHRYGLDFGEPGKSQRESLALFGNPISEPFEETLINAEGKPEKFTVQYFERARFEFHPKNNDPYKVLLGRLAADLVP